MSLQHPKVVASPTSLTLPPFSWRARRQRRREAATLIREAIWAAEQSRLQTILSDARTLVEQNWIRGAWFTVQDADGRVRLVRGGTAILLADSQIVGSCLVGAIIRAGGGTSNVREQPVQRALDVVWHALREPEGTDVRWSPPTTTRMQHLRDLTTWNDREARSADDVASLLLTAERIVMASET